MKKITCLLCLFLLLLTCSVSFAGTYCSAVASQVVNEFTDLNNVLSTSSKTMVDLLGRCASTHNVCVVVEASAPRWLDVVEADSLADLRGRKLDDRSARGSLLSVPAKNGAGRCILTQFSGGTALVWMISGWEVQNKKVRVLHTEQVQLHGETKTPAEVVRESEQVGRKLY